MRALCTVRGPLGRAGGGALAPGARLLALRAPGVPHPLHFVVEAKSRVRELRAHAQQHFGLASPEADLFGLALLTPDGEYMFVDVDSKLSKYAPKSWRSSHTHGLDGNGRPLLELHFVVQFYVERAEEILRTDAVRRLYYLQLHGNSTARSQHSAPLPFDSDADSQRAFIQRASSLPDRLDSHRYTMKRHKAEAEPGSAVLAVSARGVSVGDHCACPTSFLWSDIAKLSFDRKKFEIRTARDRVTLYSPTDDKAKYLFALCRDTHQFSMKLATELIELSCEPATEECKRDEQRVSLVSSGSSNTTSGVVSDRVHSEDELEIMIDCPPARSTESLALAHLLDRDEPAERAERAPAAPSSHLHVAGDRDPDYEPYTLAASSETSGVYTMGGSESTTTADTVSRASIYLAPGASIAASNGSTYEAPSSTYEAPSSTYDTPVGLAADCVDGDERFRPGSATSFHGDGSDPTDTRRALLSASELSDLIVGRGAYPARRSVSDTLDSVSDYVRLPPPLSGASYVRGHEDTAPEDEFPTRPPTPHPRIHSDSLDKPPPPYDYEHATVARRSPPPYPAPREEATARLVTSRPMITILTAEAGDVCTPVARTFAGPVSAQPEQLVAMLKPPPPPPRRARLPPPPPPPPPHLQQFHQQLLSDVDYVVYPLQDPRISQRNYLESKLLGSAALHYRSTPFLSTACASDGCGPGVPTRRAAALPRAGSADLLAEPAPLRRPRPPPPPPPPPPPVQRPLPKKECTIDIKTLREKSKNLDLPLISALCNDRSLLKQTKAFGPGDSDTLRKNKQLTKKLLVRNPNDKLPDIPAAHTPRALSNTYVSHPGAASKLPPRT